MYRTVEFKSTFPSESEFDDNGDQVVPDGRALAESIAERLRPVVTTVSEITQHEYYGWSFLATSKNASYHHVVNAAGEDCFCTISMNWYWIKSLAWQHPKEPFDDYCTTLTQVLKCIPEISNVSWHA